MNSVAQAFTSLSIVIPAYNASAFLADTLTDVRRYALQAGLPHEITVIDDGSRDETDTVARKWAYSPAGDSTLRLLINDRNRGKGYSVRRGMLAAAHRDWVLFMDADNSTSIRHLDQFAQMLDRADIIIASRRLSASRIVRRQHRIRQFLGRSFPYLVRVAALPTLHDTQCGFKLFRRAVVSEIFARQRLERFAFDVEVLLLARRLKLRIKEAPVDWDNPTSSTLRVGRDSFRMFTDVLGAAARLRLAPLPGLDADLMRQADADRKAGPRGA